MSITRLLQALKGGAGSGNFAHSGRPGKVGGSIGLSNTQVPTHLIPDVVYVGMHADWFYGFEGQSAQPVRSAGITLGKKTQFTHGANRTDSVYVATRPSLAATYANLYSNPILLKISTASLDKSKFYYDPLDVGDKDNPLQIAYRGAIPANAIEVVATGTHNVLSAARI